MSDQAALALSAAEFAREMAVFGPFSEPPCLAVACSGGADSLALTLLAADWTAAQGGSLVALTVDHGLRADSSLEARRVGTWLGQRGIAHAVLRWDGAKPKANLAAAARTARYRLLGEFCAGAGIPDLLLAHHQEDQAETFLLRLARGSGVDGLAAMAPVTILPLIPTPPAPPVRLLRPLLGVPKARLEALLRALGQPFIEDPSNRSPAYARNRLRALTPQLSAEGLSPARLAATAKRLRRARTALEALSATHLAAAARFDAAGFALLDPVALVLAPEEIALRVLAGLLRMIGGVRQPLRLERLERLYGLLCDDSLAGGRTLAGCRLVPWRGRIAVCREARALAPPLEPASDMAPAVLWDGRFAVSWPGWAEGDRAWVQALGSEGWASLLARPGLSAAMRAVLRARARLLPAPARLALPSLVDLDGVLAVPHLLYRREARAWRFEARFPARALLSSDGAAGVKEAAMASQ